LPKKQNPQLKAIFFLLPFGKFNLREWLPQLHSKTAPLTKYSFPAIYTPYYSYDLFLFDKLMQYYYTSFTTKRQVFFGIFLGDFLN